MKTKSKDACVSAPGREVVHIFRARKFVEGEQTVCGIRVQKGWPFWYPSRRKYQTYGDLVGRPCKRCSVSQRTGDAK